MIQDKEFMNENNNLRLNENFFDEKEPQSDESCKYCYKDDCLCSYPNLVALETWQIEYE